MEPPEPKGKLDAMAGYSWSTPAVDMVTPAMGNRPEDPPRKQDAPAAWDTIDWRAEEGQVPLRPHSDLYAAPARGTEKVYGLAENTGRGSCPPLPTIPTQ